jgi:hypothetical protein
VLSQTGGETSILTVNPDEVVGVRSEIIQATDQCTPHYYIVEQATVIYLFERFVLNTLTSYPACPTSRYSQSSQARAQQQSLSNP